MTVFRSASLHFIKPSKVWGGDPCLRAQRWGFHTLLLDLCGEPGPRLME